MLFVVRAAHMLTARILQDLHVVEDTFGKHDEQAI